MQGSGARPEKINQNFRGDTRDMENTGGFVIKVENPKGGKGTSTLALDMVLYIASGLPGGSEMIPENPADN